MPQKYFPVPEEVYDPYTFGRGLGGGFAETLNRYIEEEFEKRKRAEELKKFQIEQQYKAMLEEEKEKKKAAYEVLGKAAEGKIGVTIPERPAVPPSVVPAPEQLFGLPPKLSLTAPAGLPPYALPQRLPIRPEGLPGVPEEAIGIPPRREPITLPGREAMPERKELTPEEAKAFTEYLYGVKPLPSGLEYLKEAKITEPFIKTKQYRVRTLTPTAKNIEQFKEYMPGYDWQIGVPTEVDVSSYDRMLTMLGRKDLDKVKILYYQQRAQGNLTPKQIMDTYRTLLKEKASGLYSEEDEQEMDSMLDYLEPLTKDILQKQIKEKGIKTTGIRTKDNPARPKTQAEYNALPKGSYFIDPEDGKLYIK